MDWTGFSVWMFDERGLAPNTRQQYIRRCKAADRWLRSRDTRLDAAARDDLAAWLSQLPATPASRNQGRKALHAYYSWRIRTTTRATNPAQDLPALPTRRGAPRPCPDPAGLLMAAAGHSPMMRAYVSLLLYAALRFTEARLLRWQSWQDGWIEVVGKGGQVQAVPVADPLAEALTLWRQTSGSVEWMFPGDDGPVSEATLRRRWRQVTRPAGLDATPHQCRHRAASDLLELTGDLSIVQEVLRHASADTTTTYARARPGRVAAAMQGLRY